MNTFILSLVLVSPLLGYATFLMLNEFQDPLVDFHDKYRTSLTGKSDQMSLPTKVQSLGNRRLKMIFSEKGDRGLLVLCSLGVLILFLVAPVIGMISAVASVLVFRKWRTKNVARATAVQKKSIETEFPAFAEIYTILVVAGESPTLALIRIAESIEGNFGALLKSASDEIQRGGGLHTALERISHISASKIVRRFVDALIIAMERGTPLAEVLHRQVEDARRFQQAEITRLAGRAEIALMIPVVFLILPISVLFALWPSYLALGQNML